MAMQRLLQWAAPAGAGFSPARLLLLGLIAVAFNLIAACSSPSEGNQTAAPTPVQATEGSPPRAVPRDGVRRGLADRPSSARSKAALLGERVLNRAKQKRMEKEDAGRSKR